MVCFMGVYSTHSNDRRKHTTLVTSPLAFSFGCLLRVLGAGVCPRKVLCRQRAWLLSWITLIQSLHRQCKCDRKPFPPLVLQEMLSACFLTSFKPSSKMPSVVSIISLPFLAPYRVSAVSALIAVFIFWYCIKRLVSFVTPWCLMLFSTSSGLRKTVCIFTKLYVISSLVYSHETGPAKYCNIKGSKSGNLTEKSSHTLTPWPK